MTITNKISRAAPNESRQDEASVENPKTRATGTKRRRDDSIMATNGSSIVSKRSVERLYYDEPHFFRYFVKKFQRRSPLINRGYWLRMHAVEVVIRRFLAEQNNKRKVILNLGCGYDPLPFQWLAKDPKICQNTVFIDVDYPALISRKCDVISSTPQLSSLVQPVEEACPAKAVHLRSPHYIALGCDLADPSSLSSTIRTEIDQARCKVLCVAEVSITYMDTIAADTLIGWAAQLDDVRFCLLEQFLPNGEEHPFAQKMIQHFENLQTPLRSIKRYPRLSDQEQRFHDAGWNSVTARNLWNLWSDPSFLSAQTRLGFHDVEPFDEWEELALFASHYFLLEASSDSSFYHSYPNPQTSLVVQQNLEPSKLNLQPSISSQCDDHRRFAAIFEVDEGIIGNHGGQGNQSRLSSTSKYTYGSRPSQPHGLPPPDIGARLCHTITDLEASKSLLVGGRASPARAMSDCWLRHGQNWQRIEDLPKPLYRHCATALERSLQKDSVLIFGGRTDGGHASNAWLLWHESSGWLQLDVVGSGPSSRFSAVILATEKNKGILIGGMALDGTIYNEFWQWELVDSKGDPKILLRDVSAMVKPRGINPKTLYRLGACLTVSSMGILLTGGITANELLSSVANIICFNGTCLDFLNTEAPTIEEILVVPASGTRYPLLIGHSAYASLNHAIIAGGGAVCFSFGTYWNEGCWTLRSTCNTEKELWIPAGYQKQPFTSLSQPQDSQNLLRTIPDPVMNSSITTKVEFVNVDNARDFERISNHGQPVIIKGLDLGVCTTTWSLALLKTRIGEDRPVVVHEAAEHHMNFQSKNFKYCTKPFGRFIDQISEGSMQYLRSLASERPSEQPANLAMDFPELASDFSLPSSLEMVTLNAHSSPLRISGPVTMWLHYDVMANVLCQIDGSKRILLFPPSTVSEFNIAPGQSSSLMNVFEMDLSRFPQCREAILQPGDVLFLPPLWLHAAAPLGTTSVSINVFYRNLRTGYAAGRDVYGNRDIQAYEKGRQDISKIASSFKEIPAVMRRFYLERLANELRDNAQTSAM